MEENKIKVIHNGGTHKITFEYYDPIPSFENMVLELRILRDYYYKQLFP